MADIGNNPLGIDYSSLQRDMENQAKQIKAKIEKQTTKELMSAMMRNFDELQNQMVKTLSHLKLDKKTAFKTIKSLADDMQSGFIDMHQTLSENQRKALKSAYGDIRDDATIGKILKDEITSNREEYYKEFRKSLRRDGKSVTDALSELTGRNAQQFKDMSNKELESLLNKTFTGIVDSWKDFTDNPKLIQNFEILKNKALRDIDNGFGSLTDHYSGVANIINSITKDADGNNSAFFNNLDKETQELFNKQAELANRHLTFYTNLNKHSGVQLSKLGKRNDSIAQTIKAATDRTFGSDLNLRLNDLYKYKHSTLDKSGLKDVYSTFNMSDIFKNIIGNEPRKISDVFANLENSLGESLGEERIEQIKSRLYKASIGVTKTNGTLSVSDLTNALKSIFTGGDVTTMLFGQKFSKSLLNMESSEFIEALNNNAKTLSKNTGELGEKYIGESNKTLNGFLSILGGKQTLSSSGGIFGKISGTIGKLGSVATAIGQFTKPLYDEQIKLSKYGLGGTSIASTGFFGNNSLSKAALFNLMSSDTLADVSKGGAARIAALGGMSNWAKMLTSDKGAEGKLGSNDDIAIFSKVIFDGIGRLGMSYDNQENAVNDIKSLFGIMNDKFGTIPDEIANAVENAAASSDINTLIARGSNYNTILDQQMKSLYNINKMYSGLYTTGKQHLEILQKENQLKTQSLDESNDEAGNLIQAANLVGMGGLNQQIYRAYMEQDTDAIQLYTQQIYKKIGGINGGNGIGGRMATRNMKDFTTKALSSTGFGKLYLENANLANPSQASNDITNRISDMNKISGAGKMLTSGGNMVNAAKNNTATKTILGGAAAIGGLSIAFPATMAAIGTALAPLAIPLAAIAGTGAAGYLAYDKITNDLNNSPINNSQKNSDNLSLLIESLFGLTNELSNQNKNVERDIQQRGMDSNSRAAVSAGDLSNINKTNIW